MQNSHKYFENHDCQYYPCHPGAVHINCLFCYCPLYGKEHCPGKPTYVSQGDTLVKDCSQCTFPHHPENYDRVMRALSAPSRIS